MEKLVEGNNNDLFCLLDLPIYNLVTLNGDLKAPRNVGVLKKRKNAKQKE